MAKKMNDRIKTHEKGQSLVELAFTITVLLIMLAGIVDIGRIAFYYIAMRDAAQEGLVYASVMPTHCTQIVERIRSTLDDPYAVTITITMNGKPCGSASPTKDACTGQNLLITLVDEDFPITMPFLGTFLGKQSITLETTVEGTVLRPACK